jgi:hypothetical protein
VPGEKWQVSEDGRARWELDPTHKSGALSMWMAVMAAFCSPAEASPMYRTSSPLKKGLALASSDSSSRRVRWAACARTSCTDKPQQRVSI